MTAPSSTSGRGAVRRASPWRSRCRSARSRSSRPSGARPTFCALTLRPMPRSSGAAPRGSRSRRTAWLSRRRSRSRRRRSSGRCRSCRSEAPRSCGSARPQISTSSSALRRNSAAEHPRCGTGSSSCRRSRRRRLDSRAGSVWRRSVRWHSDNVGVAKIYALANQKGGVGKTTTAINLAACLAEAGERALVVDLDPQANATSGLGMRANGTSSYDLLDGVPLSELAKPTRFDNLFLVPSRPELAGAAVELSGRDNGERFLADALANIDGFDFVLLDCPPSLGPLTVNALAAADRVIVPVQTEYYALEGLAQLVQSINLIKARLNPRLAIAGVLLTMTDNRTRLSADVEAEVREHFGALVFEAVIPRSVRVAEAPSHGLPPPPSARRSRGAEAYWKVAMELVERL